jgi:formylglycine-generating enzyme required for sulfatase activity
MNAFTCSCVAALSAVFAASLLAPPPAPKAPKEFTNAVGMKIVLIPKGKFLMGSPKEEQDEAVRLGADRDLVNDEGPQHEVEVSRRGCSRSCATAAGRAALG